LHGNCSSGSTTTVTNDTWQHIYIIHTSRWRVHPPPCGCRGSKLIGYNPHCCPLQHFVIILWPQINGAHLACNPLSDTTISIPSCRYQYHSDLEIHTLAIRGISTVVLSTIEYSTGTCSRREPFAILNMRSVRQPLCRKKKLQQPTNNPHTS
jgi:hypothetical protein